MIAETSGGRWEPAAVDLLPGGEEVCMRLGGPAAALPEMARGNFGAVAGVELSDAEAGMVWADLREFRWAYPDGLLAKVPLTPAAWPALERSLRMVDGARSHLGAGGSQVFISLPSGASVSLLDEKLRGLGLPGLTLRGDVPLWLGARPRAKIALAVKDALDPERRFPSLDD